MRNKFALASLAILVSVPTIAPEAANARTRHYRHSNVYRGQSVDTYTNSPPAVVVSAPPDGFCL